MSPELRHPGFERHARAERRLLEVQEQRLTRERARIVQRVGLHLGGLVEEAPDLVGGEVEKGHEVAAGQTRSAHTHLLGAGV